MLVDVDSIQSMPKPDEVHKSSGDMSMLELDDSSSWLTWHNAPILNGVSPNPVKVLDYEHREKILNLLTYS